MNIIEIGALIRTQDNRITDQPIFVVEKSKMVVTDPDYGYDDEEWVDTDSCEHEVATETIARRLDALKDGWRDTGKWEKHYLKEVWVFVTACFTEKGCEEYLKLNGHNLGKTRIYAYSTYRNHEYQAVRDHLSGYCDWHQDGDEESGTWGTDCGRYFGLEDGDPFDNSIRFCSYCGSPVSVTPLVLDGEELVYGETIYTVITPNNTTG